MMYILYWYYESEVTSVASDEDFRSHASGMGYSKEVHIAGASHNRTRSRHSGRR